MDHLTPVHTMYANIGMVRAKRMEELVLKCKH